MSAAAKASRSASLTVDVDPHDERIDFGIDLLGDHDEFRQRLQAEQAAGVTTTRGVLVLSGGALPPRFVRLAFLPIEVAATAGTDLVVRRTTVAELVAGAQSAYAAGEITDDQRRSLLIAIEQRHPTPSADSSP